MVTTTPKNKLYTIRITKVSQTGISNDELIILEI